MQSRVDRVLVIFETQVIKKKRPVRSVFPDSPFIMTMVSLDEADESVNCLN